MSLTIDPADGDLLKQVEWGGLKTGTRVEKVALFPRLERPEQVGVAAT
jgi:hypothetical protein